ncbi:uncharacterized protein PITG_11985 [Phytophthora infestans T30-4]|uniref:Uncharacterized protein n=1 Tax=Phytophthora infestans (strain T30-4) TaxID=403677 RepID=D0NHP4_PHYIT|nr:uncharacterized protein PITG_11985 [Phytophthora infestans T30-4]EEY58969.1 hypothetical protein PITG_11985 [Phytophthora infestans T30-4]|eukprot:XP_002901442.1 hypothetical protein PITG_11985 [Phytophthora infestans T30-4]
MKYEIICLKMCCMTTLPLLLKRQSQHHPLDRPQSNPTHRQPIAQPALLLRLRPSHPLRLPASLPPSRLPSLTLDRQQRRPPKRR